MVDVDDVAWKKLHGDVFRTPEFPNIYGCMIGIGVQAFLGIYSMLIFTTLFFSNYKLRAYVFFLSIIAQAVFGWVNGFITARILKFFGSVDWCFSAFISAVMFPTWFVATCGFIDIIEWSVGSSSMIPFSRFFVYTIGWLAICIPLCFLGAYLGFKLTQVRKVCKVNPVRRNIPAQPSFLSLHIIVPTFGAVIFLTICAEFRYVWESIWSQWMYAMFGFLLINFLLMAVVISLLAIVQIYLQLSY